MIRDIVRSFIRNADPYRSLERSYMDYHARGLDYVNLAYGPDVVAKLYFFAPDRLSLLRDSRFDTGLVVNPHDHLYDFQTYVLDGEVANVVYREATPSPGKLWHLHHYYSPLRRNPGGKKSEYVGPRGLEVTKTQHRTAGEYYDFAHDGVHSISVPPDEETVLFLLQHRGRNRPYSHLYSPTVDLPDTSGLYRQMHFTRVRELLDKAMTLI